MKALWRTLREWGSAVLFAGLLTQFGASAVRVDGVSMMPGLRHGETVLVTKYDGWAHHLGLGTYRRGDVVVFKPPRTAVSEYRRTYRGLPLPWAYRPYLIKRVIAVAGDRVSLQAGQVSVNGKALDQSWTVPYWQAQHCLDTEGPAANRAQIGNFPATTRAQDFRVPPHTVFVMGDNRSPGGSLDSRFFGPVPLADVAGPAVLSVWPVLRAQDARVPCGDADAAAHVQMSGPAVLNWRLLTPPAAFGRLP